MTDRGVAIVTGGASGIGLAIAKALLADGWKIVIADLAQGPLDAARAQLEPIRANATISLPRMASRITANASCPT